MKSEISFAGMAILEIRRFCSTVYKAHRTLNQATQLGTADCIRRSVKLREEGRAAIEQLAKPLLQEHEREIKPILRE
ncbi:MAG: hypothetical protein P8L31_13320 [Pseudomonadales bacterium]|nr:hypothetical protein [Pseudomonadales bacterium]